MRNKNLALILILMISFLFYSGLKEFIRTPSFINYVIYYFGYIAFIVIICFLISKISSTIEMKYKLVKDPYSPIGNYDPLLLLRAFACFFVIWGHDVLIIFSRADTSSRDNMYNLKWIFNSSPWAGVWVFFVLSGYLMGKVFFSNKYTFSSDGIFRFYRNRLYRIVPVYLFVLVIVAILVHPELFLVKNLPTLIDIILFDSKGNTPGTPIGAAWSINTEMKFYLCAPILSYFIMNIRNNYRYIAILSFIVIGVIIRTFTISKFGMAQNWYTYTYTPTISNIDLFLIGIASNLFIKKSHGKSHVHYYCGLILFVMFYFGITYFGSWAMVAQPVPPFRPFYYFVIYGPSITAVITSITIILFEKNRFGSPSPLQMRVMSIGMVTYCLYIVHEPILESLKVNFGNITSLFESVYVSLATYMLVYFLACFVYKYIEKPFDAKKKILK